LIGVANDFLKT